MLNSAVISAIEDFAPLSYQESWDNTGVQVGSLRAECTGVLLCVDVTPVIIEEAHDKGCNLIISHHPLIFKGLKRLSGNTPVEEAVMRAIRYGITVYSCHTAVDSTPGGVSYAMARMLDAEPQGVLAPLKGRKIKISVTCDPKAKKTAQAVFDVNGGAKNTRWSEVSVERNKTDKEDPYGTTVLESEQSCLVEATIERSRINEIQDALEQALGDKVQSIEIQSLENIDPAVGLGVRALFDEAVTPMQLIERVKAAFGSPTVRCTALPDSDTAIRRIAMCGGSGGEFIGAAIRSGAQVYITSDTRYHDFVDYQNQILIIDIGHFESESCTKEIFFNVIREKFPNFACYKSEIEENPIKYL